MGATLSVVVTGAAAANRTLTKGSIPDAAFQAGAGLDARLVPDFVSASDQSGNIVGYVPKAYLTGQAGLVLSQGRPASPNIPVYAADLKTLVGYMVPGKGFVPLGVDPGSIPAIPVQEGPAGATVAP